MHKSVNKQSHLGTRELTWSSGICKVDVAEFNITHDFLGMDTSIRVNVNKRDTINGLEDSISGTTCCRHRSKMTRHSENRHGSNQYAKQGSNDPPSFIGAITNKFSRIPKCKTKIGKKNEKEGTIACYITLLAPLIFVNKAYMYTYLRQSEHDALHLYVR